MNFEPTPSDSFDLKRYLSRYASRYVLRGPQHDALIEQTLSFIAHNPDALLETPIEKALSAAMHEVFTCNAESQSKRTASDVCGA